MTKYNVHLKWVTEAVITVEANDVDEAKGFFTAEDVTADIVTHSTATPVLGSLYIVSAGEAEPGIEAPS